MHQSSPTSKDSQKAEELKKSDSESSEDDVPDEGPNYVIGVRPLQYTNHPFWRWVPFLNYPTQAEKARNRAEAVAEEREERRKERRERRREGEALKAELADQRVGTTKPKRSDLPAYRRSVVDELCGSQSDSGEDTGVYVSYNSSSSSSSSFSRSSSPPQAFNPDHRSTSSSKAPRPLYEVPPPLGRLSYEERPAIRIDTSLTGLPTSNRVSGRRKF